MGRVEAVWMHPAYQTAYRQLVELERDRLFCRHGLEHLIDTARIMWIRNLELGLGLDREVVYATALLHDIGKGVQHATGIPHEQCGARLAGDILATLPAESVFTADERAAMLTAIRGHRHLREGAEPLERLLYQADKASRPCFACRARAVCSWSDEKKNLSIAV